MKGIYMKGYLFLDIDGTLVDSANNQKISEDTLNALKQAKENGYGCFICSGRNFGGLSDYMNIGMDGYVFADGAGIVIEGIEPEYQPIPEELLEELQHLVIDELNGGMTMSSLYYFYASDEQYEVWMEYMEKTGNVSFAREIRRIADWDHDDILEIDLDLPDEETERKLIEKLNPQLNYVSTTASYGRGSRSSGEVTMAGITKGYGIRRTVELLGGDMKNTYGFGDSMNDASMLEACAVGVCMGNGAEELKQMADYVTGDISENGLSDAFRKLGIIKS